MPTFLAVYGLLYAAFGVQSPFLPALLREQGLNAEEIGIVLAASTAIRVLAGPVVGHLADRLRHHTLTLCACALVAAVAGLGYVMLQSFAGLLLVALVHAAMLAPIYHSPMRWLRLRHTGANPARADGSNMDGCVRPAPPHS